MAAVRVESEAENDIRFHLLAKQAGLADADHALGKMLRLWRACTNRQSYVLSEAVVACVVDPDALVAAELGERVEGGIRIRGTKGRIEWLGERRKASRKGGLANRAKWVPQGSAKKSQEASKAEPLGSDGESPNSNSPANSPALKNSSCPTSGEVDAPKVAKVPKPEPPEALRLADRLAASIRVRGATKEIAPDRWEKTRIGWARQLRLAHEADGRSWEDIERVLGWSQKDSFWQSNILSADKFREKYDQLKAKMDTPAPPRFGRPAPAEPPVYRVED